MQRDDISQHLIKISRLSRDGAELAAHCGANRAEIVAKAREIFVAAHRLLIEARQYHEEGKQ